MQNFRMEKNLGMQIFGMQKSPGLHGIVPINNLLKKNVLTVKRSKMKASSVWNCILALLSVNDSFDRSTEKRGIRFTKIGPRGNTYCFSSSFSFHHFKNFIRIQNFKIIKSIVNGILTEHFLVFRETSF